MKLISYVTQLSAVQQTLTKLLERTPDRASESSKPPFEPGTEILIKIWGSGGPSLEPLWEGPYQVIFSSAITVKVPGIEVHIKTLGSGGPSIEPLWEGPYQVILSSPTAVKVPGIDLCAHHTRVKN